MNFYEEMALNTNMFQLRRILASDRADSQDIKQSSATQNTQVSMPIYICTLGNTDENVSYQKQEITQAHIRKVLQSARPSVPPEERERLNRM